MALQTAASARTTTDSNQPVADYTSLTVVQIDASITTAISAGLYHVEFSLNLEVRDSVPKILQSDDSIIDLEETKSAIESRGYNVGSTINGSTIELRVTW